MDIKSGFVNLIDVSEFDSLMQKGVALRIKAGFDPTAPDLHLGHAVLLKKLRQFQDLDPRHVVVMIVGNATAAIGDPTGRNQLRPPLSDDQINTNAWSYMSQAFLILKKEQTLVRKNAMWFDEMKMSDVLRLMSNFTLSNMMARDEFKDRQESGLPIYMHELVYPMMQAYDSYREGVDIELGGSDQFFNLMVGRDYMRMRGDKPQIIATVPLLVGLDGKQKMSKSYGNHIALTEEPFEMYSKVMSISDETMDKWWSVLFPDTFLSVQYFGPFASKQVLAHDIVAWLHSKEAAAIAAETWKARFSQKVKPVNIPVAVIPVLDIINTRLDRVLVLAGLAKSVSEAGRLIKSGAVDVNGTTILTNVLTEPLVEMDEIRVGRKWTKITQQ